MCPRSGVWLELDVSVNPVSSVLLILKFVASRAEMLPSVTMLAGVWYVQVWLRLRRAVSFVVKPIGETPHHRGHKERGPCVELPGMGGSLAPLTEARGPFYAPPA